jgi:hypothetical protein
MFVKYKYRINAQLDNFDVTEGRHTGYTSMQFYDKVIFSNRF